MARLTPQEKKALSYEKDRRNAYGGNDKASRKAVPLRKRLVNRANRHDEQRRLRQAVGPPDEGGAEAAEAGLAGRRPKRWRKWADRPLREHVQRRVERRADDG